jgi:hypothetical protein
MAVREGATTDGLNLTDVADPLKGVTCFFCHAVDDVSGTYNNPLSLSDDLVMRGEYSDPVDNEAHASTYSNLHDRDKADSARMCGSCHDIVVNAHAHIERTFQEWTDSVFSTPNGQSCSGCHMLQSPHERPIADAPGVFARYYHSLDFPGFDLALTDFPQKEEQAQAVDYLAKTTVQPALCVVPVGGQSAIRVVIDNAGAGHGFPSGSAQDRRVFAEVVAYQGDTVVYQSGVVADGASPTDGADPDEWLLRDCMLDKDGQPVSMFWQADSYETNQLPGQKVFCAQQPCPPEFYLSHIVQSFPRDPTALFDFVPDKVTLRLRIQPVGLDVLGDLTDSGDLDASVAGQMKTMDIDLGKGTTLTWTPTTTNDDYLDPDIGQPAHCVKFAPTLSLATLVKATNHTACSP